MDEQQVMAAVIPQSLKDAIANNRMDKVAEVVTGLDDFTLEKVAAYLGGRMAARQMRWRPVAEGLAALAQLR
jgi:hypothetical protein